MREDNFYFDSNEEPRAVIVSIFDMDISISNGWGYEQSDASRLQKSDIPLNQLEHTLASMRTHLEMSITQPKDEKYGGINLNEKAREEFDQYQKVTYVVTAILENQYNNFIDEYKEKYGKEDFDMAEYFQRRREATITREISYWFLVED